MLQKVRTRFGKVSSYSAGNPEGARVLVVPGYSETIAHNRKLVDELGKLGMFAATLSQPRKSRQKHLLPGEKLDPLERQAQILITMLDRLREGVKITAVGHSMGAAAVLKAAQARPDRFERIILEQPSGFSEEQRMPQQAKRVAHKVGRNQWRALFGQGGKRSKQGNMALPDKESPLAYSARVGKAQNAAGMLLARNGVLALQEAKAAGRYDATADWEAVTELGIPIHVVGAHSDELYGHQALTDAIMPEDGEIKAPISYPADRLAGHDTLWMQPKLHAASISSIVDPWTPRNLR